MMKKEELENFCIYLCRARNFSVGIWFDGRMYGIRHKFGDSFVDFEYLETETNGSCIAIQKLSTSLSSRISAIDFDEKNWRSQQVLYDILFVANSIFKNCLENEDEP